MPFTGDSFAHLFDWEKDPQRQEKIVNSRLEAEFDGIDTGLSDVAARVTVVEGGVSDNSITNAKLADMAEATVKGRAAGAGTGDPTDLSADQLWAVARTATTMNVPSSKMTFDGSSGAEGGQFQMEKPATTSLEADVSVDINNNSFRVFENGGSARGFNVDLTQCAAGAGTNLLGQGLSLVEALAAGTGTSVTSAAIGSPYKIFFLAFDGLSHNNGGTQTFRIEISTDGGSTYSSATDITSALSNATWSFSIHIYNANDTAKVITSDGSAGGIGTTVSRANAITHLRFSPAAGNFDAGTIYIFGL